MKQLLYRPSWQGLRVGLLQENSLNGGWTTEEGVEFNIDCLRHYVNMDNHAILFQAATECRAMGYAIEQERSLRLFRTINLLNATRMGYSGQGLRGTDQDVMVLEYRNQLQKLQTSMYMRDLTIVMHAWDWSVVKRELRRQHDSQRLLFDLTRRNLIARFNHAASLDKVRTRPELVKYLDLMDSVGE